MTSPKKTGTSVQCNTTSQIPKVPVLSGIRRISEPSHRPQTARILRPSNTNEAESLITPRRPQTARERTAPTAPRSRKLYASRPLSGVPIVHPPLGTPADVVEKHWPDATARKVYTAHSSKGNKAEENSADSWREPSPVDWSVLEKLNPLAAVERRILNNSSPLRSASRVKQQGKYQVLCPAHPHHLRPSSSIPQRRHAESQHAPTTAQKSSDINPKSVWELAPLHDGTTELKVYQKTEPVDLNRRERKPINQQMVDHVVSLLPMACEGRLMLDPQLKKVIIDHEEGFFERIHAYKVEKKGHIETEIIRRNSDAVKMPDYREWQFSALSARAQTTEDRIRSAKDKKLALEFEFKQQVQADLEWRMGATVRKQLKAEQIRIQEMQCFMLTAIALERGALIMIQRMVDEKTKRADMAKKKLAVKVIIKHFIKFRMKRSSEREANALLVLAMRLPIMVKRWRIRSLARKTAIVISYLRDISNFAKLQLAVKQFRRRIVKAQQLVKNWLACKRARYEMLEMQFNKVDEMRNHEYNVRREAQLRKIKARLDRQLELKGKPLGAMKTKVHTIQRVGGPKAVNELKAEVEASRLKFCEKFLSPDMQQLPQISPIVKAKMLQLYVKKIRTRYQLEYAAYRMKRAVWAELRESQTSIRQFANNLTENLNNPQSVAYFNKKIGAVVPDLEPPKRPLMNIVLPPHLMAQIIQKAVEHTQRLAERSLGSQMNNRGILKSNAQSLSPPRRQPSARAADGNLDPPHQTGMSSGIRREAAPQSAAAEGDPFWMTDQT